MSKRDFPIPFPSQGAEDDLHHARNMLEILTWSIDNGVMCGLSKDACKALQSLLCDVTITLDVVQRFLDTVDQPGWLAQYQDARRQEILARQGGAS